MVDLNNNIEFREESDEPQSKEASIREIVLRQIKKIGDLCSQEFTGGYWQKKPIKVQGGVMFSEEYHQDVREAYCVAVEFITDLVYPFADDELRKAIDKAEEKEIENIKEKIKSRRKLFRQLNEFFDRDDFFINTNTIDL
jgi:hypothetical protein